METIIIEENKRTDILKIIAIITMLIDHIGYGFFPQLLIYRAIGRIAYPIFAYHIVVGYRKTSNLKNYALRLGVFALISQVPYLFFGKGLNIFFTLLIGLLCIYLFEENKRLILGILLISLPLIHSSVLRFDYGLYGVLTILLFHVFYNDRKKVFIGFTFLTLLYCFDINFYLQMFAVLAVPLFYVDWKREIRISKYAFYCFYPLHITVLLLISSMLFRK